jgi:molybdopterin synthase sulfurtransferase
MNIVKCGAFLLFSTTILFAQVSTQKLLESIGNPKIAILDTRSEDSYNGWILNNESRNGHIKSALPFPLSWSKLLQKDNEILKNLREKKEIILYGVSKKDMQSVASFLKQMGLSNIDIYNNINFSDEKKIPLVAYKNYKKLVPASYINALLKEKKDVKIFEASWGDGKKYKKAHIPTAVHINTDLVEKGPIWNYKSKKELKKFALTYGISQDTPVIVYGPDSMPASRVAIALMAMGVKDVRLLNGGFQAWKDAGYKIETGENKPKPISSFGGKFFANANIITSLKEAQKILKSKEAQLVSIRAHDEFIGKISGYSYIKPKGHIKGAIWGKAGSDAYHLQDYRSPSGKMKSQNEIETMWKNLGVNPKKHLAFYCGTGWRAAEVLFDAYVMGYDKDTIYDGGWLEWSLDPKRPVVVEYKK